MATTARRCEACGNYIDDEDLFCSNCGRESPREGEAPHTEVEEGFMGFDCESCGASLTYDAQVEGLRCSFCGSVRMKRQPAVTGRIRAEFCLPFEVTRDDAVRAFRSWISRGFFRPSGLASGARLVSMQAVYIPFWTFRGKTHTYYTGDSSHTPAGARASWCPVFGERSVEVNEILVCASGSLAPGEVRGLAPFDFSRKRPYRREELHSYAVEDFGVSRRGARPLARALILEVERAACVALIPGSSRNVNVNPLVTDMQSDPVLLPVWINAYRFRDVVYRFCVNGQTGKIVGNAPFSLLKLALIIVGGLALAAAAAAVLMR